MKPRFWMNTPPVAGPVMHASDGIAERKRLMVWACCLDPLNLGGVDVRGLDENLHGLGAS